MLKLGTVSKRCLSVIVIVLILWIEIFCFHTRVVCLLFISYVVFFLRESNRRGHSKPGAVPYVPERKKNIVGEVE